MAILRLQVAAAENMRVGRVEHRAYKPHPLYGLSIHTPFVLQSIDNPCRPPRMHLLKLPQHPQNLLALSWTRHKRTPYEYRMTKDDK